MAFRVGLPVPPSTFPSGVVMLLRPVVTSDPIQLSTVPHTAGRSIPKSSTPQFTLSAVSLMVWLMAATVAAHFELGPQPPSQLVLVMSAFIDADASSAMMT